MSDVVEDILDLFKDMPPQAKAQTEEIYWFFEIIEREKMYERWAREGQIEPHFYFITFPEPYLGMMDVFFVPKPAKKSITLDDANMDEINYIVKMMRLEI